MTRKCRTSWLSVGARSSLILPAIGCGTWTRPTILARSPIDLRGELTEYARRFGREAAVLLQIRELAFELLQQLVQVFHVLLLAASD